MIPTKPISPLTATAAAVPTVAQSDDHQPHLADVHAEARRLLVADAEHVEQPPVEQDPGDRDGDVREQDAPRRASPELGSRPRIHE